ncbi:MAG: hypothetical protein JST44_03645 [Cyanobacteria bacterium SZAS LIN-5]|nr:hypothetical protein [Cyanobacteria bacterium SZAS LIN-5]
MTGGVYRASWFGLAYLGLPALSLVLFVVFAACGAATSPLIFPLTVLVVCSSLCYRAYKQTRSVKIALCDALVFGLSILVLLALSAFVLDNSWDGQAYHQETVLKVAQGWNPIRNLRDPFAPAMAPWFNAKAHEFVAVTMFAVTGLIETGKATNFFLLLASIFLSFDFFRRLIGTSKAASFCAISAAFNPVVLVQLSTFYVDGCVASGYLCLLSSLGLWFLNDNQIIATIGIVCSVCLLANLKLSAVLILLVTFISMTAFSFFYQRDSRKFLKLLAISSLSAAISLVVGINPYAINLWHLVRHPAQYLRESEQSVREIGLFAPVKFLDTYTNHVTRIGVSILAKTNNCNEFASGPKFEQMYPYKLYEQHANLHSFNFDIKRIEFPAPFFFDRDDLTIFQDCDVRLGGFGPWFGEVLIAALFLVAVALALIRPQLKSHASLALYFAAVIAASTIVIAHAWWARYASIFWLFPNWLLLACYVMSESKRAIRLCTCVLYGLLLCDSLIVAIPNWSANYQNTLVFREQISLAKEKCRQEHTCIDIYVPSFTLFHSSIEERYREAGVPCRQVDSQPRPSDFCYRVTDMPFFSYAARTPVPDKKPQE